MSKYGEIIEEEATRAEAEPDEEEADAVAEVFGPELEPEPEPEPTVDYERAAGQMERENTRHAKRVAEIMGADAALVYACPTCSAGPLGFVFELPPSEPELKQASDTVTCEACGGWGDVLTGAKVDRGLVKQCVSCGGFGYVTPTPAGTAGIVLAQPVALAATRNDAQAGATVDAWGRPFGHQHWGLPPATIGG